MSSSIAINNHHADKSLPPLLLLPSVIHFEAHQGQSGGGGAGYDGGGGYDGATTPTSSYDSTMLHNDNDNDNNNNNNKPRSPYSESSNTSLSLERLALLAISKNEQFSSYPNDSYYNPRLSQKVLLQQQGSQEMHADHVPGAVMAAAGGGGGGPASISGGHSDRTTVTSLDTRSITPNAARSVLHYGASYNTPRSPESTRGVSVSPLMAHSNTNNGGGGFQSSEDCRRTSTPPPSSSHHQEPTVIAASKYKRQRTGPSCDICRSKKIKCDATISILFQDASVTSLFNNLLHSEVDIGELGMDWVSQIPEDIKQALLTKELTLLKHVDKLIAFKPCTSCFRRKNCFCTFSKGFTRADINVFTNLCIKSGQRDSIDQFNLNDYRNCGYQI
ncbi:Sut1p Ecym_6122 [Eremothecium cymbalariae DBVPG|uniref:Zn(2)-C6 fungal-type domain-containing protein n=1 Tax=Eremothecium cymbalariae (strain CBS 270.75 / DBVPG 7215 / KCTC 17166 / NRRL Y-17582) TaxID=931890 RepID=G8JV36_ERECY|nr:hypothetical protein Ecym_6122 [Eremothecium cymbalariae DBVPG\